MKYTLGLLILLLFCCSPPRANHKKDMVSFLDTIGGEYEVSFLHPRNYNVIRDQNGYLIGPKQAEKESSNWSIWFENKTIYSVDSLQSIHCQNGCSQKEKLILNGVETYKLVLDETEAYHPIILIQELKTINLVIKIRDVPDAERFLLSLQVNYISIE